MIQKTFQNVQKQFDMLKEIINQIFEDDYWDLDNILLEHDYADSTVFDRVVYFMAV